MTSFPGQITTRSGNGCMYFPLGSIIVVPYIIKAFFVVRARTYAFFRAVIS